MQAGEVIFLPDGNEILKIGAYQKSLHSPEQIKSIFVMTGELWISILGEAYSDARCFLITTGTTVEFQQKLSKLNIISNAFGAEVFIKRN